MATIGDRFEFARSERFLGLFGYAPKLQAIVAEVGDVVRDNRVSISSANAAAAQERV